MNDLAPQVHSPGGFRGEDAGVDLVLVGHGLHATNRRRELFHLVLELGDASLQLEDALDAVEVDPLLLGEVLNHPQGCDIGG